MTLTKAEILLGVTRRLHIKGSDGYPDGMTCYATLHKRDDGHPVALSLTCNKLGALDHGLLTALALTATVALEAGVPLERLAADWKGMQFDPAGMTGAKDIPMVKSIVDYLGRWLETQVVREEMVA